MFTAEESSQHTSVTMTKGEWLEVQKALDAVISLYSEKGPTQDVQLLNAFYWKVADTIRK